jgi:hypothetical protein
MIAEHRDLATLFTVSSVAAPVASGMLYLVYLCFFYNYVSYCHICFSLGLGIVTIFICLVIGTED